MNKSYGTLPIVPSRPAQYLLDTYAGMLLRSGVSVPTPKSQNGMSNRLGTMTLYVSNPAGQSSRYWSQRGVTPANYKLKFNNTYHIDGEAIKFNNNVSYTYVGTAEEAIYIYICVYIYIH